MVGCMIRTIDMNELHKISGELKKTELILDVRTAEEFAEGHVPGSQNIPYDEVLNHTDEFKKFDTVFLYCRSGGRVEAACYDLVIKAGIKNLVAVIDGGMPDWIAQGFPVEK